MTTGDLTSANEFCVHHKIEMTFIQSLNEYGLIEIVRTEGIIYLPTNQLPELEKMVRLYYELEINLEGIETINHLLQRISDMQHKIAELSNKLNVYEK